MTPRRGSDLTDRLLDLQRHLLLAAWDVDGPAGAAEMLFELAEDRRDGEAGEAGPPPRVEAIDRAEQPDGRDLHQVLERLIGRSVAAGQPSGQRKKSIEDRLAGWLVAVCLPADDQGVDVGPGTARGQLGWCGSTSRHCISFGVDAIPELLGNRYAVARDALADSRRLRSCRIRPACNLTRLGPIERDLVGKQRCRAPIVSRGRAGAEEAPRPGRVREAWVPGRGPEEDRASAGEPADQGPGGADPAAEREPAPDRPVPARVRVPGEPRRSGRRGGGGCREP